MTDLIKDKLNLLPTLPGCYMMKNKQGEVIYVGKAKVLKNRVKSYFLKVHNKRTQLLVSEIVDFEYIVTDNELEALILEMNLIKQYDPKYNVLLTDDKTYPYIKLTGDTHPRLVTTRQVKKDKGKYFGPYPNAFAANETVRLLNQIYPLRKCRTLPKEVCLYYHIDQCLAPCVYDITPADYEQITQSIVKFLKGDISDVKKELAAKMNDAAEKLEFERAKEYRDLIASVELTAEKQQVTFADFVDRDVFGYAVAGDLICIQVFFIRGGKMIERDVSIIHLIADAAEEVTRFIAWFYERGNILPKEILITESLDAELLGQFLNTKIVVPKIGSKKKLVEMANKNAALQLQEKEQLVNRKIERTEGALDQLARLLNMEPPTRIEAFDNSHHGGVDAVSAMVVFKNGSPSKKDYRKYKIKVADGADDYGMMREVIYRRYFKVLNEDLTPANLIVVDGGVGQLRIAREVLFELGFENVRVVGLVKDDKHRTRALIDGKDESGIPFTPENRLVFTFLAKVQEEVHRFALGFHRTQHKKRTFTSRLDGIPGVGTTRKERLMKEMKSIDLMLEADDEAYGKIGISSKLAAVIREHLKNSEK